MTLRVLRARRENLKFPESRWQKVRFASLGPASAGQTRWNVSLTCTKPGSTRKVLAEVAAAVPTDVHPNIIIIGSLAAA